jgi:signal peptidase I
MRIVKQLAYYAVVAVAVGSVAAIVGPRLMGWDVRTVLSSSMEPTFSAGAIVAVKPIDASQVEVGDVVMYRTTTNPPFITHRVVAIEGTGADARFTLQGDANTAPDAPVPPEAIAGRVVYTLPLLGYVAQGILTPAGLLILACVFLLIGALPRALARLPRKGNLGSTTGTEAGPAGEREIETSESNTRSWPAMQAHTRDNGQVSDVHGHHGSNSTASDRSADRT